MEGLNCHSLPSALADGNSLNLMPPGFSHIKIEMRLKPDSIESYYPLAEANGNGNV